MCVKRIDVLWKNGENGEQKEGSYTVAWVDED